MNYIDFSKLTPDYFLDPTPDPEFKFLLLLLIFSLVLAFLLPFSSAILEKKSPIYRKLSSKLLNFGLTCGLIGIALILFRFQAIPYLSMRLILLLWLLASFAWTLSIALYSLRVLPHLKEEYIRRQRFERYLPKSKKERRKLNVVIKEKTKQATNEPETMKDLIEAVGNDLIPFKEGDLIEVSVLSVSKNRIVVDVQGLCLGIIPEKELSVASCDLKPGDKILAYLLLFENDEGNAILSLKRADKERLWNDLRIKYEANEPVEVKIADANKGGLMIQFGDIEGFMPVSQLAAQHYPRVGNNKDEIFSRLQKLIGMKLMAKVINFDTTGNKLIFSEKAVGDTELEEKLKGIAIGDKLVGNITGIADFGLFFDVEGIEGLAHISEISWDRIEDLNKLYKVGDKIDVQVINIENGRLSLSIKRLLPDPWENALDKYEVGAEVKGEVTRMTPFGAFVKLDERIDGLAHISEIGQEGLKEGESYRFKILSIDPEAHKISLGLAGKKTAKKEKPEIKEEKTEKKEKAK